MATLLQLVLDGPDRGGSLEMARQLADLVDAFELGPRLLQAEGPAFVNVLKGTVPDRPVACWAETEADAQALLEVGVEGLTAPPPLSPHPPPPLLFPSSPGRLL